MAYAVDVESDTRSGRSWLAKLFRWTRYPEPYRPDPQPLAPFAVALEEGLLIARHGVNLAVKNRLIVRALRDNSPFDDAATRRIVDEELARAADEQRQNARMMTEARATADPSFDVPDHAHDYHWVDKVSLGRRERLYLAVADTLESSRSDPDAVAAVVDRARAAAWRDIRGNLESRLDEQKSVIRNDPAYERERPDRLRQFLNEDLAALIERGGHAHEESER